MNATTPSKPKPSARLRPAQTLLPLESAQEPQRIPEAIRQNCVDLIRQLLESVVLKKNPSQGAQDER